ncbi:MAG: pseudouridine synthase [Ignavibacteriaceae bacterium]
MISELKYFVINKPFNVLSQFTDKNGRKTLGELFPFPKEVYPIGRLDYDSEGLLLLSNDKKIVDLLLNPRFRHEREYLVQVEGIFDESAALKLAEGVIIEGRKTLPARVKIMPASFIYPERTPPIRERKSIPISWVKITISEGKRRQVRKMTASAGFPTLRLIRIRIANILLNNLTPGKVRELSCAELFNLKLLLNFKE